MSDSERPLSISKGHEDRMIVIFDASEGHELTRGTEILSIDGIPSAEILTALLPYVSSDGMRKVPRVSKLDAEGYDFRYYEFDVFFPLVFNSIKDSIRLEIQGYGKDTPRTVHLKTMTLDERAKALSERYPDFPQSRDDLWKFEIIPDNIGLLKLNSFGLMGYKSLTIDYKAFLAKAFAEMKEKEVDELIIDIRENNGGNDEILEELYTYFDIKRVTIEGSEGRTRYVDFPNTLRPYVNSWGEPWYYDLSPQKPRMKEGYYIFPEAFFVDAKNKRKKNHFSGKMYLLTSPSNVSLAYYFATNFKTDGLGVILGEETGGNIKGINGGQILFLRLPYSQVEVDFPVMGEFNLKPVLDQGIQPDIEVHSTQEDIFFGRDRAIEEVIKLVHN